MKYKDLLKILQKIILIISLLFLLFIVSINILKISVYIYNIKKVVKECQSNNDKIKIINSSINDVAPEENKKYDFSRSYTGEELGFDNALFKLNGSEWGDGINILLIGSDKNQYKDSKSRADVIIILRIINTGKILSISIPRDSLIKIQDSKWQGQKDKINHSYYWGGLDNLKKDIEYLIGSPINKVVLVDNFRDFEAYLAIIGGIKIDKFLYGSLGIQWIRNRNFKDGDIERCKRQEVFLKRSIIKTWKITKKGSFIFSNLFYENLTKIIETDIQRDEFIKILQILKRNNFDPEKDFLTSILPGTFGKYDSVLMNRKNIDCWILDEEINAKMRFLFYSKNNKENFFARNKTPFFNIF
jgi:anionic cell wall polymer biosynthesis LytR-Cps2A-Psr (LCP) family protein